jgi:FkbM family methyltransferase
MNELEKYSIPELYNEIHSRYDDTIVFKKFKLKIDPRLGGAVYLSHDIYAGTNDKFYDYLSIRFPATVIIDIGANIGLSTLELNTVYSSAKKVIIEPNGQLLDLIKLNLDQNNVTNYIILNNLVGDKKCELKWQKNEKFSVDSRVSGLIKDFIYETGQQITLNDLVESHANANDKIFIKIDTQGYEERIINGCLEYLLTNTNYLIKMEFAPFCLESQNTDSVVFLKNMINNFDVVELSKMPFKVEPLEKLFDKKLNSDDVKDFVEYVKCLDREDRGWAELLVKNKAMIL